MDSSTLLRTVSAILADAIPELPQTGPDRPFRDLSIDSFGLLDLRVRLEREAGVILSDLDWVGFGRPADLLAHCATQLADGGGASLGSGSVGPAEPARLARRHNVEMPQMAVGGLSESWLFKELGDLHWALITRGLNTRSSAIRDGVGDRLYATFVRVRMNADRPLSSFTENEALDIDARIARYGAGVFVSQATAMGAETTVTADIASSFSKRGEASGNTQLLKGQPLIPPGCGIPELERSPDLLAGHRARRADMVPDALFSCEYTPQPYHDLNGVGLLYFAAYPVISDLCALRFVDRGNRWAVETSTLSRDVCYFGNCDLDDRILYRLHRFEEVDGALVIENTLWRVSDGAPMAHVLTRKALLPKAA